MSAKCPDPLEGIDQSDKEDLLRRCLGMLKRIREDDSYRRPHKEKASGCDMYQGMPIMMRDIDSLLQEVKFRSDGTW